MDNFEKAQIKAVQRFLRRYGLPVGIVLLITLTMLIGQNVYRQNQIGSRTEATELYIQFQEIGLVLTQALRNGNISVDAEQELLDNMEASTVRLRSDHKNTGYAAYASLQMGSEYALRGDLKRAEEAFRWSLVNSRSDTAKNMAKILLARLLLEQGEEQQAALLLEDIVEQTAFVAELRGDILRAQNKSGEAIAAYQEAKELGADEDFINYKLSLLKQQE